jgi:hypothetical protein
MDAEAESLRLSLGDAKCFDFGRALLPAVIFNALMIIERNTLPDA